PESVAVPFPLSVNLTPDGSVPVSDNVHVGWPVDVTVTGVASWLTVKVAAPEPAIWHAWLIVRVKLWVPSGVPPLMAVIVNGYVPAVPAAGVPASVAVPSLLSVKVTPVGRLPVSDNVHVGDPVDMTVTVPAWPTVKVLPAELVIWHPWTTVRV